MTALLATALLAVTDTRLVRLEREGSTSLDHEDANSTGLAWSTSVLLEQAGMRTAAVLPQRPDQIFCGARGGGVSRSRDGGASWERMELAESDVYALAIGPADGAIYAGTEPSRLFRSRDQGDSWDELTALQDIPSRDTWSFPPRPQTSHVRWIAPHPTDADLLLVGIELGGVMRTTDGGRTFHDHPTGAVADVHALAWHPEATDRAYEAGGGGTALSTDRGASWQRWDAGRTRDYCWGLAVDPANPDRWFTSAARSAHAAHRAEDSDAAIYRTDSGGSGWERIGAGLPEPLASFPYALAATDRQLFVGLDDGRIYASDDHGDHFSQLRLDDEAQASLRGLRHLIPLGSADGDDRR